MRIGYLDEDSSDIARFHDFLDSYKIYEMKEFTPRVDLESLIEEIVESHLDAIVIDYRINEYENIPYTGISVIDGIKRKRRDFPCILLTSHADEVLETSDLDPLIVYAKEAPFGGDSKRRDLFEKKLRKALEQYKKDLDYAEKVLNDLSLKSELTIVEERALDDANIFIESNLCYENRISRSAGATRSADSIFELITKTEQLLLKIKEK